MTSELTDQQISNALQGISVPPQPQIMVDLQMEQLMPDPDPKVIARLISQDPGLSGSLLKVVNSPFFGLANRISSIQQAVSLLGVSRVVNIVNAQSIRGELTDENIVNLNRFWDSAQDVAMTCMTLAKRIGCVEPDEAYALGLFHNCGIPLMLSRFPYYIEVMEESYAQDQVRLVDVENDRMNTNHAVIGYYTAKSWLLPRHLCDAIASHHNTEQVFLSPLGNDPVQKNLLAILKMAEHICQAYRVLGNHPIDHEWNTVGSAILEYVGLSEYDFENLEANCQEMTATGGNYYQG